MNKTTILQNSFNADQNKAICNFQNCLIDKNIYNYDVNFNKFLNEIVLNILIQHLQYNKYFLMHS